MVLHIQVKPQSKIDEIRVDADGHIFVKIKAPPVDGKANAYLVKFIAAFFEISPGKVQLLKGSTSKFKKIEITDNELVITKKLESLRGA